ncbi:hypothetical protein [Agrobacterium tumefaciens]|uniref:hypothetical protein n=1 Tax=Agrobacterium tumefaciens TaxID=358 RepID=UPI001573DD33|nr:hypothetical protein [Agrobacterium tumefaciens]
MDLATHDAVVEDLTRKKLAVEADLRAERQRCERMSNFLDNIGLNGKMIGDSFPWEHHVAQLMTATIDDSKMADDLAAKSRMEILHAARSVQHQAAR